MSSALGSALEWIDFAAYGAISATVLPALFFPTLDPNSAILASFASFGVGFVARPAGGLLFGLLGDRHGRKNVLLLTLMLMGVSSFLIGVLPTYATIGVWAPASLVLLRFLQGLALGGEATGAQLMTMEHAPPHRRGLVGSFINMGNSISQVVANGALFLIAKVLTPEEFLSYGWRIPFVMSLVLVFLGLYIRLKVSETPAFEQLTARKAASPTPHPSATIGLVFRHHSGTIARLLLVWAAPATCFYVINVFSLSYLTNTVGVPSQTAFLSLMIGNVVAVLTMIAGGAASDRFGRKAPMAVSLILMLLISVVYFPLLRTGSPIIVFAAMSMFIGSLQIQSGVQPAFYAEHFPTSTRYAGSAMAYTGANLFFAGPTPFLAAWLMQWSGGQTWVVTTMCVAVIGLSFVALMLSPETRGTDLTREA